ncbi:MAG: Lrp/AsnC family transcriptional regulator [Halobacteriales archaeon]|nr:Lrp/AsnC family transcriptional regulator [Halobacteriales archaeon]
MAYAKGSYEHRILAHLKRNGRASLAEFFPVARIDTTAVKNLVKELTKRGELEEYKPGHYQLGPNAPELEHDPQAELGERILGVLGEKGRATRNALSSATGQPAGALKDVLKGLADRGLIEMDSSGWSLTKRGQARVPSLAEAEPTPKEEKQARRRAKLPPAPPKPTMPAEPPKVAPAPMVPALPKTVPAPAPPPQVTRPSAIVRPTPSPQVVPASAASLPVPPPKPLAKAPAPTPRPAASKPVTPAWDDGFVFVRVPRVPFARVTAGVLDVSDAALPDGWVELRWDGTGRRMAVVPLQERTRQAVRMEAGCVATPHSAALLGEGRFPARWDAPVGALLVGA